VLAGTEPPKTLTSHDEEAGADAHIRLQTPARELFVLEEAVAHHDQQAERHGLHVRGGPEVRDVAGDGEPRDLVEPAPEPETELGRAPAAEVLLLLLTERREGELP